MHREQLRDFKDWFVNYVKSFYSDNPESQIGIKLKEDHTWRVCENIIEIGKSLCLGKKDLYMAEAIALFHDVGRFKQYSLYRTFNDQKSENHALLGVQELKKNAVLSGLDETERHLILTAVEYHNLRQLPPMPRHYMLFTRLIRDADKLDILKVVTEHYCRENNKFAPVLEGGLPDTPGYSPAFVEKLLNYQTCLYSDIKNSNDRKLLQLSWIFDINFSHTMSEIIKKGYIEKIINSLPATDEIARVYENLQSYVARRLGEEQ